MDPDVNGPTPWDLALGLDGGQQIKAAPEEVASKHGRALDIDVNEPLLIVGAFNQWGKGFPQNPLAEFILEKAEGSGNDEQESHVCVTHTSTKLSFKIISARHGWNWQIYPQGEGESLKELRLGVRAPAQLARDHEDKAAHGRNFRIWECANQCVQVRVLLSRRRGIHVWYERVQFERVRHFQDAPHLFSLQEVVRTSHGPEPLLQGLARHFGAEAWAHCPCFGTPESVMRDVQKEVAGLIPLMLPGLTADDFKRSLAPVPKSRTDRIMWVDDKMLQELKGLRKLSEMLVQFVSIFTEEVQREGHSLTIKGNNRPMLAVYDEGSFFKQHVDVTSVSDPRTLTLVYYLNPKWNQEYGGALRLWPGNGRHVDIWPEADSLVLFRSDEIRHEVRKSNERRLAITIWFNRF